MPGWRRWTPTASWSSVPGMFQPKLLGAKSQFSVALFGITLRIFVIIQPCGIIENDVFVFGYGGMTGFSMMMVPSRLILQGPN